MSISIRMTRRSLCGGAVALIAGAGTIRAQSLDVVRVHTPPPSMSTMPFLIADEMGFYRQEKIQYEGHVLNTDVGVMATVAGNIDATQILGLSLRGAIDNGFDLKIVMIFTRLPTYSLLVRKGIKSYADLKGKKIGTTSGGASASKILVDALESNGLDVHKDVTLFYMGATPTIFQALVAGTIDACTLVDPFDVKALQQGFQVLPFAETPGLLQAGVSANGKLLRDKPDVARRFLLATQRGLEFLRTDKEKSIALMSKLIKIDAALAEQVYDHTIHRFSTTGVEDKKFIDAVLKFEFDKATPELEARAFDFSILQNASTK